MYIIRDVLGVVAGALARSTGLREKKNERPDFWSYFIVLSYIVTFKIYMKIYNTKDKVKKFIIRLLFTHLMTYLRLLLSRQFRDSMDVLSIIWSSMCTSVIWDLICNFNSNIFNIAYKIYHISPQAQKVWKPQVPHSRLIRLNEQFVYGTSTPNRAVWKILIFDFLHFLKFFTIPQKTLPGKSWNFFDHRFKRYHRTFSDFRFWFSFNKLKY